MPPKKQKGTKDLLLDRTPPHDLDAEESLLSAIFINNDNLFEIVDILEPDDFYKGAHKKIFKAIVDLAQKDEPADLVTVANRLNAVEELESIGGAAYLAAIADAAPVAVNSVHYARIVKGKSVLRQLISASSTIIESCINESQDFEQVIEDAENVIFQISEKRSKSKFQSLGELINLNIDKLEEQQGKESGLSGLSTGYTRFNQITSGLQATDLIIVAARPSMGKTAFALNIARNVAVIERKPVAVFSLEMSNTQLSMRLLTSEARIDSNRLRNSYIKPEDWQMATDAAGFLNELPIFIDDTPNISMIELRSKVRRLHKQHGELGVVVIDYLQLMKSPIRSERRDLEIAAISSSLKALAKEMNVPVVALSQLNRTLETRSDKRPLLSDLRESGSLEQDADIVAFIYRDEVYNKEADNPKKGTAEIIVAKNRNGAIGTAFMHFHGQYTRFEELASDDYQDFA